MQFQWLSGWTVIPLDSPMENHQIAQQKAAERDWTPAIMPLAYKCMVAEAQILYIVLPAGWSHDYIHTLPNPALCRISHTTTSQTMTTVSFVHHLWSSKGKYGLLTYFLICTNYLTDAAGQWWCCNITIIKMLAMTTTDSAFHIQQSSKGK